MAVNWDQLKTASAAMLKNAAQAVIDAGELQTTVTEAAAKASGADKTAWEGAGTELATMLAEAKKAEAASKELDTIADGKKDDKAGDAEKQRQTAQTAAEQAIGISEGVLTKLKGITGAADAREDVEALATLLKVVKTQAETKAKPALGEAPPAAVPPGTPTPPVAVPPGTPTPPAAVPPGTTPAEKAVAAATEAETSATTAETEAKNIDKATDLAAAKAVATKVVTAATAAKTKAGEAATEANKAKTDATGTAKTAWEEAIGAANLAKAAAETAEAEAKGIATAADLPAAKAAAPKVVTAATTAKLKATTAKQNVDKAKSLGASETSKTPDTPKKAPGAFGMSVTAAYSKKFSLETKMHSEIKVTMVPYPPPALFLDWIRDHFEQVKKERDENSVG